MKTSDIGSLISFGSLMTTRLPLRSTMWPGTPTMVELSGMLRSTTDPAPTRQLLPTVMLPRTLATRPDNHFVANGGMALAFFLPGATEGDALVNRDVVADDAGLANDYGHTVIDAEAASDLSAGVDFDSGE